MKQSIILIATSLYYELLSGIKYEERDAQATGCSVCGGSVRVVRHSRTSGGVAERVAKRLTAVIHMTENRCDVAHTSRLTKTCTPATTPHKDTGSGDRFLNKPSDGTRTSHVITLKRALWHTRDVFAKIQFITLLDADTENSLKRLTNFRQKATPIQHPLSHTIKPHPQPTTKCTCLLNDSR